MWTHAFQTRMAQGSTVTEDEIMEKVEAKVLGQNNTT